MNELNNLTLLGVKKLAPDDIAIYFFVRDYMLSPRSEKRVHGGKLYVKVDPKIVKQFCPQFTKEVGLSIASKLRKLCSLQLLEGQEGYYSIGSMYDQIHGLEVIEVIDNRPKKKKVTEADRKQWLVDQMSSVKSKWKTKCGGEDYVKLLFNDCYGS